MKLRKKNKWIYPNKRKQFRKRVTLPVTVIESLNGPKQIVLVNSWIDFVTRFY